MKERPILFSGPMVNAILEGRKTMTRRVVKPQPEHELMCMPDGQLPGICKDGSWIGFRPTPKNGWMTCPYGQPGDRLWVRENARLESIDRIDWSLRYCADGNIRNFGDGTGPYKYFDRTVPSIHMPRWASRITLEVMAVRVERLEGISQDDAVKEGCDDTRDMTPRPGRIIYAGGPRVAFMKLWESINGPLSWDANPWVWVVEFKRVD